MAGIFPNVVDGGVAPGSVPNSYTPRNALSGGNTALYFNPTGCANYLRPEFLNTFIKLMAASIDGSDIGIDTTDPLQLFMAMRKQAAMLSDFRSVFSASTTAPPGAPAEGDAYLVPAGATGAWTGQSGRYTRWNLTKNVWDFETLHLGAKLVVRDVAITSAGRHLKQVTSLTWTNWSASQTDWGLTRLATDAEVVTGTATTLGVNPLQLAAASGYGRKGSQFFFTPGAANFVVPAGVTGLWFYCQGGGGGGAGGSAGQYPWGGVAGVTTMGRIVVTPGQNITMAIGGGGTPGTAGGAGGAGGDSGITGITSAGGGVGGAISTSLFPPATSVTGGVTIPANGWVHPGAIGSTPTSAWSGGGGASFFGAGGPPSTGLAGLTTLNTGAGGGGGANGNIGGSGSAGMIWLLW